MNTKIKALIIICIILGIHYNVYSKSRPYLSAPEQLGLKFLQSQNIKDQSQFRSIMNTAMQRYRGNEKEFHKFLDFRDGYGCTTLIRAAALVDMDEIVFILEKLEEYYGTTEKNVLNLFSFLNARCLQGHSAFYLLIQNGTYKDVQLMLYHVIRLIGSYKYLFLQFLTAPTYENKWTPLHWLAYQGDPEILRTVVLIAEKKLGKDSPEYDQFINAEDEIGETPLSQTYFNTRFNKFLLEHGATILHKTKKDIQDARQIGLDLIEAIREDRFSVVQKLVFNAQEKYKDQPKLFLQIMMTRTQEGWDPLMHAAALSFNYLAFLLHAIERFFQHDEEAFYSILRNVEQAGRGALFITILRRNFIAAKLIIEKIKSYSPSKYFLYILLNIRTYGKGFTPLIAAVDYSSDRDEFFDFIEELIKIVAEIFGKDSRPMSLFINTQDNDGFPAFAYAATPRIKALLQSYGAHIEDILHPSKAKTYKSLRASTGLSESNIAEAIQKPVQPKRTSS